MRRLLAILLPGLLLLTACGGTPPASESTTEPTSQSAGEIAKLDSVKLTDNGDKKAPGVEFDKPLEVKEPTVKVITEGNGDRIKAGQFAEYSIIAFNGTDGTVLGDTFDRNPDQIEVSDELKAQESLIYNAFVGAKVGSHIAIASPGKEAAEGAEAQPSELLIVKLISAKDAPKLMSQEETDRLDKDGKLPKVTFDDKGSPAVEIPKTDAPADLSVKILSEGSGDKVAASDTIEANYTGWRWEDGTKFDSSYDRGEPASFGLENVIKGWTVGLTDQKVGSKLLLTIPTEMAYGRSAEAQQKPSGPLVFVVEIKSKK